MAKKKSLPWDKVFDRVRVIHRIDGIYPPKPTTADLNNVEAELAFQFPLSYRAFAEQFGLHGTIICTLPHLLPLRKPIQEGWSVLGETLELRATYREYWTVGDSPSPLFERMVVFAEDGGYEKFVFDPVEVTDAGGNEYRIYSIDKTAHIEAIGDSFPEFLVWLHDRYRPTAEEADFGYEDSEIHRWEVAKPDSTASNAIEYKRFWLGEKQFPEQEEVKLWLSFNHNTARDLALAIRDHGQTDAFPILADALQEAGCTNMDLLDSCRHGDPDIDGVWVLQVLLGKE